MTINCNAIADRSITSSPKLFLRTFFLLLLLHLGLVAAAQEGDTYEGGNLEEVTVTEEEARSLIHQLLDVKRFTHSFGVGKIAKDDRLISFAEGFVERNEIEVLTIGYIDSEEFWPRIFKNIRLKKIDKANTDLLLTGHIMFIPVTDADGSITAYTVELKLEGKTTEVYELLEISQADVELIAQETTTEQLGNTEFQTPQEAQDKVVNAMLAALQKVEQTSDPEAATGKLVTFEAASDQTYGFDAPSRQELNADYPSITVNGSTVLTPWKSLKSGMQDKVIALDSSGQAVMFEYDNVPVTAAINQDSSAYNLSINGSSDGTEGELVAKVGQTIVGKLNTITYDISDVKVKVVPVNGAGNGITQIALQNELNKIYAPAIATWQVEVLSNQELGSAWDDEGNGLEDGETGMLSNYTEEMNDLITAFKDKNDRDKDAYYVFLVDRAENASKLGYMPRKKQWGFIFTNGQSTEAITTTIAHELGHGVYRLEHPFAEKGIPRGQTQNLMDYANGRDLYKYQWDYVHNPTSVITLFDEEEDAANIGVNGIPDYLLNERGMTATFISPSGTLVILPSNASTLIFAYGFNTLPESKRVSGTIVGFKVGNKYFYSNPASTGIHSGFRSQDDEVYKAENYISQEFIDLSKTSVLMILPCGRPDEPAIGLVKFRVTGLPLENGDLLDLKNEENFPLRLYSENEKLAEKQYYLNALSDLFDLGDYRQRPTETIYYFLEDGCSDPTIIPRLKAGQLYSLYPLMLTDFLQSNGLSLANKNYEDWVALVSRMEAAIEANESKLEEVLANISLKMKNYEFENLMRMLSVTDYEKLTLEQRLLLLQVGSDFTSFGLGDKYLRNLIVHTPIEHQKALINGLITYERPSNGKSLLQSLLRDLGGIDGTEFTQTITTLTNWALTHSPSPEVLSIDFAITNEKYIKFKPGFWLGDVLEERFDGSGNIFLSTRQQFSASVNTIQAMPFEYVYIEFAEEGQYGPFTVTEGQKLKLPTIFAYMLFNNENTERIHKGVRISVDVALFALGVGELNMALRAKSTWRLYRAVADLGIAVADFNISNVLEPYLRESEEGRELLRYWNEFMLYYGIGAVAEVAFTTALHNMRYKADQILNERKLISDDGNVHNLTDDELDQIDNLPRRVEEQTGLTANPLLATIRSGLSPTQALKEVFDISDELADALSGLNSVERLYQNTSLVSKINTLNTNKIEFLTDLTRTRSDFLPNIGQRISDIDDQLIEVWVVMKQNGSSWPNKRLSYDYLYSRKGWATSDIVDDLGTVSSRTNLANRIEVDCPNCAEVIRRANSLNANVRARVRQLIQDGQKAPNGMGWDEIYTHYLDEASRLGMMQNGVMDWDLLFTIGKYQAHHKFPVNLFADDNGAFRFMFENIPSSRQQELLDFFNSADNGIMVPNKRTIDGVEYVIHTNHPLYENKIAEFLNGKRSTYLNEDLYDHSEISEFLFNDLKSINNKLDDLIIEKSLLGNSNINDLNVESLF